MNYSNRRDLCSGLAVLAAMTALNTNSAYATPDGEKLNHSELFPYDKLPVRSSPTGGASRAVLQGTLATGEFVEVHESTLPAGQMPHPPHRHTHSEFLLIRDRKLEVNSDGQRGIIEAGGIIFTASGVLHSLKNVGDAPANYFVVAVGLQKAIV
jgi:quercetin dioxygenase-like cupin family protein